MQLKNRDILLITIVMVLSLPLMYFLMLLATGNARIEFGQPDKQQEREVVKTVKDTPYRDSLLVQQSKTFKALQQEREERTTELERLAEERSRIEMMQQELENARTALVEERRRLEQAVQKNDASDEQKIKQLAKVYGSRKPIEAAQIMETLEDDLFIKVLTSIGDDRQKAKIMELISKAKAARISVKMAKTKR